MSKTYRGYTYEQVASAIDHSILKPNNTVADITEATELALKYQVASVCVRPMDVAHAAKLLSGSKVKVGTVIGFPHGTTTTNTKVAEAIEALQNGAVELDMVLNVGHLVSGNVDFVEADIRAVVDAAKKTLPTAIVKVILETAFLNPEQIVTACELIESAGGDYVKTSTGFAPEGATLENVRLMKQTVGDRLKVKSSGGVRTLDQLIDFLDAGCSRSGCSATGAVLEELLTKLA
jgi:deoxyribose-phosphate aldolase